MLDAAVTAGITGIERYGLVVLFVIFVFEGAIVGKVIPTRTLFVGALILAAGTVIDFMATYVVAVLGATVGQVGLFAMLRYYDVRFHRLRWVPIDASHIERAEHWFDTYGLPAVAVGNVLPVMRGSITVPVAMSNTSPVWFTVASGIGSVVYLGILVGIAFGIDSLLF